MCFSSCVGPSSYFDISALFSILTLVLLSDVLRSMFAIWGLSLDPSSPVFCITSRDVLVSCDLATWRDWSRVLSLHSRDDLAASVVSRSFGIQVSRAMLGQGCPFEPHAWSEQQRPVTDKVYCYRIFEIF